MPKSRFVMAVNSSGIFFMERKDRTFLDISYIEVKKVEMATYASFLSVYSFFLQNVRFSNHSLFAFASTLGVCGLLRDSVQSVNLSTIRGEFVLKSIEADDMKELLENNLEGLRKRSVYAVAQQDVSKPGKSFYPLILLLRWPWSTNLINKSLNPRTCKRSQRQQKKAKINHVMFWFYSIQSSSILFI